MRLVFSVATKVIAGVVVSCSAVAQTPAPPELPRAAASIKVNYEAELASLAKPLVALDEQYRQRLAALKKEAEARGDLEAVLAFRTAIASLESSPHSEVPIAAGKGNAPAELTRAAEIYSRERDRLSATYSKQKAPLQEKYFTALDRMVISLTRGGQIEDAVVLRKYLAQQRALAKSQAELADSDPGQEGDELEKMSDEEAARMMIVRAVYGESEAEGRDVTAFMVNLQKTNGLVRVPHATWVPDEANGDEKLHLEFANRKGRKKSETYEQGYLWKAAEDLP